MERKFVWFMALALSLSITTTRLSAGEITMTHKIQEQHDVFNVVKTMTEAFENKDIDAIMGTYEKKPLVVFEPEKPITDRNELIEMFKSASSINPKFDYSGHEVFVNGDIAVHIAPWAMKATLPDGNPVKQTGLSVAVLRKQPDGKWLMVIDNPHAQLLMSAQI